MEDGEYSPASFPVPPPHFRPGKEENEGRIREREEERNGMKEVGKYRERKEERNWEREDEGEREELDFKYSTEGLQLYKESQGRRLQFRYKSGCYGEWWNEQNYYCYKLSKR